MSRLCSIEGCGRKHDSRGYCSMHVRRALKSGAPGGAETLRARNGAGYLNYQGYFCITINGRQRRLHDVIAERAIGRPLPKGAVVHHGNGVRHDNRPENLVICQDGKYHALLHVRMTALAECGDASKRKCKYCKKYDLVEAMRQLRGRESFIHNACHTARQRGGKGIPL